MNLPALHSRERDATIHSLRYGVIPITGARYIQVGRDAELATHEKNLDRISVGSPSFWLIASQYGSGGEARSVYGELMQRRVQRVKSA